jgi:DNA-binding winged helix-turn-helix (wHTH) protein
MPQSKYEFGRCTLDLAERRLWRDGRPVALTPRVFELLRVLVENAGHLVEKERLLKTSLERCGRRRGKPQPRHFGSQEGAG